MGISRADIGDGGGKCSGNNTAGTRILVNGHVLLCLCAQLQFWRNLGGAVRIRLLRIERSIRLNQVDLIHDSGTGTGCIPADAGN